MPGESNFGRLYDALKTDHRISTDLSREDFISAMEAPGDKGYHNRLGLFNSLKTDGFSQFNTYEEFAAGIGLHAVSKSKANVGNKDTQVHTFAPTKNQSRQQPQQRSHQKQQQSKASKPTAAQNAAMADWAGQAMMDVARGVQRTNKVLDYQSRKAKSPLNVSRVRVGGPKSQTKLLQNNNVVEGDQRINPDSGELEQTYLTSDGGEYTNRYTADMAQNQLDAVDHMIYLEEHPEEYLLQEKSRIENEMRARAQELEKEEESNGSILRNLAQGLRPTLYTNNGRYSDQKYTSLMAQMKQVDEALETLRAAKEGKKSDEWIKKVGDYAEQKWGKYNPLTWAAKIGANVNSFLEGSWRGFVRNVGKVGTWDMGFTDALSAGSLYTSAIDNEKGKAQKEQKDLLNVAALSNKVKQENEQYLGRGYKAGEVTATSLPFIIEMMLNPASGMGQAAQRTTMRYCIKRFGAAAVREATKNYIKKFAFKYGARLTGDAVGSAVMAATTGQVHVVADQLRRMTGDIQYTIDSQGNVVYGGRTNAEDNPFNAYAKAFGAQAIENHSEMLGEYFAPVLGKAGSLLGKGLTKATSKSLYARFGVQKIRNFIAEASHSNIGSFITNLEKRAKWNGTIGEYAEEVAGNIENAILVGDNTLDTDENTGVFNLDQNIDTFLGVALMGGFISTVKTAQYAYGGAKREAYNNMNDVSRRIDRAFAGNFNSMQMWGKWRNTLLVGTDEEKKQTLRSVLDNKELPMAARMAVLDYAKAAQTYQGICMAQATKRASRQITATGRVGQSVDDANEEGYQATNEEKNAIRRDYRSKRKRLLRVFGEEAKSIEGRNDQELTELYGKLVDEKRSLKKCEALYDYMQSKARYYGMIERAQDDIDDAVDDSNRVIDSHTNQNGMIQKATLKADGRQVFIVSGNVSLTEDGEKIDTNKSDQSLVIVDVQTGKREMIAPSALQSVDEPIDAAKLKQDEEARIRGEKSQQEADVIDGKLAFNVGDEYGILDYNGKTSRVKVLEDKGETVLVDMDGRQVEVTKKQVQQMYDDFMQSQSDAETEQAANENGFPPYGFSDEFDFTDKEGNVIHGEIQGINEDGVEIRTETPYNGQIVQVIPKEDFENMITSLYREGNEVWNKSGEIDGTPTWGVGSRIEINGHEYRVVSINENDGTVSLQDENGNSIAWTSNDVNKAISDGRASVIEEKNEESKTLTDNQGNPINEDGTLKVEEVKSVDELTDEDFSNPTRNVQLPTLPQNVDAALNAKGKPVIIKKNIFEKNWNAHKFPFEESRTILNAALYNTDLVGQTQPSNKPLHWVAIKIDDKSPIVVLEVNEGKENVEIVGWYTLDERNLNRIKRQAAKNGGELVMLSPKDKVESLSTPQTDLSSESKVTEQSSILQAEDQENVSMPMRTVGKGKNAREEEDWLATSPERGHDYIFSESGLDAETANTFVENKLLEAKKNLDKVKKNEPKIGTSIAEYKSAKQEHDARVAEAQKEVDYWNDVKAVHAKRAFDAGQATAEDVSPTVDSAYQVDERISQKWNDANKIDGDADEITLPNGESVKGHYVLTESGAASASHQATNGFSETEGFPVDENGQSVNDRDYKRDQEAQEVTRSMARDYDSRALQSPVVVSREGVVLSGNGRTMAGEIAAQNGTDKKYNDYLRTHANKYGFTEAQVNGYEHPRVLFVPDADMPYTAETFAKFNQREQKSQNKTEQAVKMGKVVDDALFGRVMQTIGTYDTLGEFYGDDAATHGVVKELAAAGVIPQTEMAQLFDGGKLSDAGQAMVEGVLIGKVFQANPDAVREITEVKSMRQSVMAALQEIVTNSRLGGGYDLSQELAEAIDLVYKARKAGYKAGMRVSEYAGQGNLFQLEDGATVADYTNAAVMMLSDVLNDGRTTQLKKVIAFYNRQAADAAQGIGDMFAGGVKTKEDIINEVNEALNNGQNYNRNAAPASDGQGRGNEGGEQGDVASPGDQVGERGLRETFDGLASKLKSAEGEERMRVLGEMRDGIARFAEENGYPVPEFLLTREDFLAAVPEKDKVRVEQWLNDGWHCPAYYEKGKVYYFVEGCDNFDKDVLETLSHEYTHADNAEFPETVNALVYAIEDTHEVSQDELIDILETLSNSSHYEEDAERLESEGKNPNKMLSDEVIAHAVARMSRDGVQVLDGITKNPTLQFIIKRAYKVRENERRHNILASETSERSSKTIESSEANSGNSQSVAEGESRLGRYGRSARSEVETGEQSSNGRSTVTVGEEVAAPSSEGAKDGVTDGEKSSATGDVVPLGNGDTPLSEKIATASAEVNTEPTEAQKEAGNYKKGHVQVGTFDITIEQPQGSVRKGTDADGKQWESKMNNTYGYIRGAVGVDGDHIDVFLSNGIDGWNGRNVFVVDQYNPDGSFDEHKVMLGFNDAEEAKSDYLANYENGWENGRRIDVTAVNLEDFEKWIASSKRKTKPFGEYAGVKKETVAADEMVTQKYSALPEDLRQQKAEGKSAQPPTREETILRDAVIDHMKGSGLDVLGTEDGQRVLDMANGRDVRLEAARHKSKEAEERDKQLRTQDLATALVTGKSEQQARAERRERERKFKEETKELYDRVLSGNFDDVTLRLIDDYISNVTPNNYYGRPLSKRLPKRALSKMRGGEQAGSVDALFSRISESAVGANERTRPEAKRRIEEKKKELLKGWAIATGNWHTDIRDFTDDTKPIGRGKDSDVYHSKDGDYVIKVSKGKDNLKRFRPDMDNVALFNYVFPGNSYDIVGYGEIDGKFVRFLRQPIVDFTDSTPLSVEERVAYMEHLGFKPMNDEKTAFTNGEIVASDIQGNNIVKDKQGNIRVIDADMRLHTKDIGGKYAYPPVEKDAKITDHVRFFRTANGEAYGFTVGGKIYIDPRIATAETPVHEYAHLWASALKANNAKEWQNVVDLMKGTSVWEEVKKAYPELKTDDEIADEVLATYSGRRGAERLREEAKKISDGEGSVFDKAKAVSALERVRQAIEKFWKAVADFLHIHYTSAEQVADQVMKDLLNGVDPRSMMDGGKSLRPDTEINIVEGAKEHGFKNYAEAKTWAKEHIARTYSGEDTGGKGDIRISNAAVEKYLSQSAVDKSDSKDVHLSVLKVLPEVIRESVDAEQHADFKKGEDGVRSAENGVNPNVTIHRLYGAVRMDGKLYRVKVTLKENARTKETPKAYSYEATKIELLEGSFSQTEGSHNLEPSNSKSEVSAGQHGNVSGLTSTFPRYSDKSITAANLLNGVEKSYGGGKFFEDYNKIREQFIGEQGAERADHTEEVTTRLDNLSVAREMENDKKDAKAIKMATGWERGVDGKWRYEIPDLKYFGKGDAGYKKAREKQPWSKELDGLSDRIFDGEELSGSEYQRFDELAQKEEKFKTDYLNREKPHLADWVENDELFKAYPDLKRVELMFTDQLPANMGGSYNERDHTIVVNTNYVGDIASVLAHEVQHAIQKIEGFASGGNPESMKERFEAAKEEWRARAWADALRDKADEMGEHYNQAAVEKALIDEYKEMGMDNDEWMPNKETRMKGFNYFARGYADRSLDADIKNFRLNESTRSDFSPYVEYTKLGGEVESRNVEHRMNMTPEERRASLAAETEDVSREDQIFLMSGDGGYANSEIPQEMGTGDDYSEFAKEHGVDVDMVKDYASGMKTGNLQKADIALAEIRRTMRVANRGMKLSEFGKLFRPVQKELAERYGDIESLRQEHIDAAMRERGVMDAARKRAEEEVAKRKAHLEEMSLLTTEELDKRYFDAIEIGDDAAAREMLDEAARRKGYDDTESNYQGVGAWSAPSNPGYENDAARRADVEDNAPDVNIEDIALGYSLVDEKYWQEPRKYMQTDATAIKSVNAIREAIAAVRRGEKNVKVKVYRAVPTSVKEGKLRNGDWVTPSKDYAKMHGEHRLGGDYRIIEDEVPVNELWWDGNDSREWGFDDGKGYKYKNVENNRKLNDLVTRDDNGEIIAPSKRFDENVEDVRYRTSEELDQINQKFNERLDELVSNPNQKDKVLHLGRSSEFLKDGGISDAEIVLEYDKLVRKSSEDYSNHHPYSAEDIHDLPIAIHNPIALFENTKGKGGFVILTELKKDGRNFIAALRTTEQNRKGGVLLTVNEITTLYPKEVRGIIHWINQGKITNVDKEKALHFIEALQPHAGTTITSEELLSAANVVKDFETLQLSASEKAKQQAATDLAKQLHVEGDVEVVTTTEGLTGRQAKAKGWYDVKTGKVTIVLPNNKNAADVRETVFHEVVTHKGLRSLVGDENFNTFLDNIYANAEEKIQQSIDELSQKYGGDKRKATEEYMAGLAEDGEFAKPENQSFFRKVKDFFVDLLRKVGIKLGFKLTDNDLRYILWRSWKNLKSGGRESLFDKAEDVVKQNELGQTDEARSEHGENGIMFRDGDDVEYDKAMARDIYEKRVSRGLFQTQEAIQDSMLGLKEAMNAILKAEGKKMYIEEIPGYENPYLGENRLSSVSQAECTAFAHTLFKPLLECVAEMAPTKAEREQLTDYMMAKHGLERNEVMAKREAQKLFDEYQKKHPQGAKTLQDFEDKCRERDYAGLTSLTGTDNVADAETKAKQMVDDYESKKATSRLWWLTNKVNDAILTKTYESGIISKDTYDDIKSMYDYYIPLRGFDEKTGEETYAYLSNRRDGGSGSAIRRANGRSSKADDPFANMESMAESAIMHGNRNTLVKQKFLNFALNHPSDLVSVSDLWLWHNDATDEWQAIHPGDIQGTEKIKEDDSPAEVERKIRDFETAIEQAAQNDPDHYMKQKDRPDVPYRVVESSDQRQHQVIAKRNGIDYVMIINGNPRAAQALNGQTNPDNDVSGAIGALMNVAQAVNRQLSAFYTTRNPDFVVSNFVRDALYANTFTWVKESPNYALRFHKNFARVNPVKLAGLLYKFNEGILDKNDELERMFDQFMMNGGETGYTNVRDIEKHKTDINRELKKYSGGMSIRKGLDLLGENFDLLNRSVENCARFAAFVTSRQMGRSLDRSIYDAKEISVNFNKKGSGAKFMGANGQTFLGNSASFVSGLGRSFYVFWNAAIQGTTNFGRQFGRHPVKAIAGAATMFMLGALMAGIGGSGGDGDDGEGNSYYDLPDFVRRSNILFRFPWQKKSWVSIPLPTEYRAIYGMGELMMSLLSGKVHYTAGELATQIAGQFTQILPLDILEGGGLTTMLPSYLKPVVEVMSNKAWTGMPIYKDSPFNKDMPEWTKAYSSANKYIVGFSKVLNEWTGGDNYTKGWADLNPAKIEYMLGSYFGGFFTTVDKLVKMAETALGDREYDPKSMLVVNRLIKQGDERTEFRAINNEYFRIKEESEKLETRLRNYERDTASGVFNYAEKIHQLNNAPGYQILEAYKNAEMDLNNIDTELSNQSLTNEERAQLEELQNIRKKELVEQVNDIRKGKKYTPKSTSEGQVQEMLSVYTKFKKKINEINKLKDTNLDEYSRQWQILTSDPNYIVYVIASDYKSDISALTKKFANSKTQKERKAAADSMISTRNRYLELLNDAKQGK